MTSPRAYFNDDTIVAIATAPHAIGAIGIVRVSGSKAWEAVASLLKKNRDEIETHRLYRSLLVNQDGKTIDDVLFAWMKAPHSYTGEELIEIHMHGNPLLLQEAVDSIVKTGYARVAQKGEFSFRAFQNGKIDLSQAEAVLDLINSQSPKQAEQSLHNLLGSTKTFILERKQELMQLLAQVEVDIDFSDQGLSVLDYQKWRSELVQWNSVVVEQCDRFEKNRPLREGIRLALLGEPNSGKSTLFNRLLGEERSIVSPEAGTTRDVVRETFRWKELLFLVSDTAGLRNSDNEVEAEGIRRSLGEVRSADLIFLVVDAQGSDLKPEFLTHIHEENPNAPVIVILNKIDLADDKQLRGKQALYGRLGHPIVALSAMTGSGFDELEHLVIKEFSIAEAQESFAIGRIRHSELLRAAVGSIQSAVQKVDQGDLLPDLLASDLRSALNSLGEVSGEVSADDVLNFIFAEFCIGK